MHCLFVSGIPDDGSGQVSLPADSGLTIAINGSCNVFANLPNYPGNSHVTYMNGSVEPQNLNLKFKPNVIFNEISDPDSHKRSLSRCVNFINSLGCPVVNHPDLIINSSRDLIAKNLSSITNIRVPNTVRLSPLSPMDVKASIKNSKLKFPLIFRKCGDHGGVSTVLIEGLKDINTLMYQYPLDGRDYYLTEFVDYPSDDGLYRKYRIVVVGGQVFLRHMIISDNWLIHSNSRYFMADKPELVKEEKDTLTTFGAELGPKIIDSISEIIKVLKLDYFGVDCNINDKGEILIFEINANMNILVNSSEKPNIWEAPIFAIKKAICQLTYQRAGIKFP